MKNRKILRLLALWLAAVLLLAGCGGKGGPAETQEAQSSALGETGQETLSESVDLEESASGMETGASTQEETEEASSLREDGSYTTPEEVAAYLREYGHLPDNFITKKEARALGWDSSAGNLWEVTDHKSIGGDVFGNNEGLLPEKKGRTWYECDVNYSGGYRGGERIVFSSDGLIYYTNDHYQSFQEME